MPNRIEKWKIDYVLNNYTDPLLTTAEIAKKINMTENATWYLIKRLKIQRPDRATIRAARDAKKAESKDNEPPPKVIIEDLGFNCVKRTNVVFHEKRASI